MSETPTGDPKLPARYELRIRGHLSSRWTTSFDGMTMTAKSDGTTLIEGPVVDQAALHGLLSKLRDFGLPLLSLTQVDPTNSQPGD